MERLWRNDSDRRQGGGKKKKKKKERLNEKQTGDRGEKGDGE